MSQQYQSYITIADLERYYPKDDIIFMSGKYYEDEQERTRLLNEYILSASQQVRSQVTVHDPFDPKVKDFCCRIVFYMLCRRFRKMDESVLNDYDFCMKEMKAYYQNYIKTEGITGNQPIAETITREDESFDICNRNVIL